MRSVLETHPPNRSVAHTATAHRHEADSEVRTMGEWKAQISVRVSQALRMEMEEFAVREHRTLSNLGGLLVEWSFAQLKVAGSTERLRKVSLTPRFAKRSSNRWGK